MIKIYKAELDGLFHHIIISSVKLLIFCEPLCGGQNSVSLNSMSLAHDY